MRYCPITDIEANRIRDILAIDEDGYGAIITYLRDNIGRYNITTLKSIYTGSYSPTMLKRNFGIDTGMSGISSWSRDKVVSTLMARIAISHTDNTDDEDPITLEPIDPWDLVTFTQFGKEFRYDIHTLAQACDGKSRYLNPMNRQELPSDIIAKVKEAIGRPKHSITYDTLPDILISTYMPVWEMLYRIHVYTGMDDILGDLDMGIDHMDIDATTNGLSYRTMIVKADILGKGHRLYKLYAYAVSNGRYEIIRRIDPMYRSTSIQTVDKVPSRPDDIISQVKSMGDILPMARDTYLMAKDTKMICDAIINILDKVPSRANALKAIHYLCGNTIDQWNLSTGGIQGKYHRDRHNKHKHPYYFLHPL